MSQSMHTWRRCPVCGSEARIEWVQRLGGDGEVVGEEAGGLVCLYECVVPVVDLARHFRGAGPAGLTRS